MFKGIHQFKGMVTTGHLSVLGGWAPQGPLNFRGMGPTGHTSVLGRHHWAFISFEGWVPYGIYQF